MTKKLAKCFGGQVTLSKICPKKKIRNSNYLLLLRTKCILLCLVAVFLVSNERQTYLKKKKKSNRNSYPIKNIPFFVDGTENEKFHKPQ